MRYPLIYAFSTVGILKHYNQDYLIHEQRTDFTGANGVGKSIIADLFQLIFINDRQLFQFGTEGYKKDARQIHKLPHKCNEAYAFLTIEVDAGKFICIGVCIPNTTNRAIKPFIITADPDPRRQMIERAFGRHQLPVATQFINAKNQISAVDELGRHFRDKFGLYFEHFSNTDQKDEHFARLYDQELLPIDLSIPSSKKAFAKIIQSFSRARSGGDKSEELKDFLFDGVEKDLEQSFDHHKNEINKILQQYGDLLLYVEDLESKQHQLTELSRLEELCETARKAYLLTNCGHSLNTSNKAQAAFESKVAEHKIMMEKADLLVAQLPRLKGLETGYQTLFDHCQLRLETMSDCQEKVEVIKTLNKRIKDLTFDNLPAIAETLTGAHPIDDYEDQELLKRLWIFIPVYQDYGSVTAIEEKIEKQKKLIQDRKEFLEDAIKYHGLVKRLFSSSGEDTLIARVLQSDKTISPAQEAVLFYFLKSYWGKPVGNTYPYYAEGFDFFNADQIAIDDDSSGYWLRLGDLHIAIPLLQHEPVLGDPALRSKAVSDLLAQQDELLDKATQELLQLQFFEKGKDFDSELAPMLANMDKRLYDYAILKDLEITAQLILQLDGKTECLMTERDGLQTQLLVQLKLAGIAADSDINILIATGKDNLVVWKQRAASFQKRVIEDVTQERTIRETSLPNLAALKEEKQTHANRALVNYLTDRTFLEGKYPELIIQIIPEASEEEVSRLRKEYSDAAIAYQGCFRSACEQFSETRKGANSEIAAELKGERFSFPLLERILLGKIRYLELITEELRTANESRHKMIKSIHETMLKIFIKTKTKFEEYRTQIRDLNLFFGGKTISNRYLFQVAFLPNAEIPIDWINQLQSKSQVLYGRDELPIGQPVENFIEDFFKVASGYKKRIAFRDLLDPRTYFTLDAGLFDENGKQISGSTGETYSAKVLLGIGRLSKVQSQNRRGIRFIILEETANLDKTNFNNFPAIADEFGYQIITMTPKPFGADATAGWYLHHLLPGKQDPDRNYPVPASYFKTNTGKEDLVSYLKERTNELDRTKSTAGDL
jgi:hypothetical protein